MGAGSEAKYPEPSFDLNSLLPENKDYYSYIGSLVCIHVMHATPVM